MLLLNTTLYNSSEALDLERTLASAPSPGAGYHQKMSALNQNKRTLTSGSHLTACGRKNKRSTFWNNLAESVFAEENISFPVAGSPFSLPSLFPLNAVS